MRKFLPLRFVALSSFTALAAAAGCAAQAERAPSQDDAVGHAASPIQSVIPGQADLAGTLRMGDANVSRASYATGKLRGSALMCSGTMIGPNIVMTSAHCGTTVHFEPIISSDDHDDRGHLAELFPCTYILSTFPESDLMLGYCPPNAAGESPGIKYGYLDFDLTFANNNKVDYAKSRTLYSTSGITLYSFWWNPVTDLHDDMELIYSRGSVRLTNTGTGWYNPAPIDNTDPNLGQCGDNQDSVGLTLDIYSASGCSGSSVISEARNRIIAGPTSIAPDEGTDRGLLPIVEYLEKGVVQTPDAPGCGKTAYNMVNGAFINQSWGLTAANFKGLVDADHTGVFDIQEAIELAEGEHTRSAYWFDFDSSRSNQLWGGRGAGISTERGIAVGSKAAPFNNWQKFAKHDLLHLKPNTKYHVKARVGSTRQFRICLDSDCLTSDATSFGVSLFNGVAGILDSGAHGELSFWGFGAGETQIDNLALVEMGTVAGFSTQNERDMWIGAQGTTATMSEMGANTALATDFAGVVRPGTWTLSSANLPFSRGSHRVCFDARQNPLVAQSGGKLRVQVTEDGVFRTGATFAPGTHLCTPTFNLLTDVGEVLFGGDDGGSYLVDNVSIE